VKRATAALGLTAIVTGVPVALVLAVGSPRLPSFEGSEGLSGSYVPAEALLGVLGLLAWGLWAYVAFAVVLNVLAELAAIRRMPGSRALVVASRLLTPRIVRSLVEVAVGGAFVAASVTGHVELGSRVQEYAAVATVDPLTPASNVRAPATETPMKATYRVRAGDSLWRIAERELGSGFRWREIYRLNKEATFPDGGRLTNPHLIRPGWVLELPEKKHLPSKAEDTSQEAAVDAPTGPSLNGHGEADPSPVLTAPAHSPQVDPSPDGESDSPESDEPEIKLPARPVLNLPSGLSVAASFASGMLTAHLLGRLHRRRSRRVSEPHSAEPPEPALTEDLRRAGASPMAGMLDAALHAVVNAWRESRGVSPRILAAMESDRRVRVLIGDDAQQLPPTSGGSLSPSVRFARADGLVQAEVDGPFPTLLRRPLSPLDRGVLVPIGRAPDGSAVHVGLVSLGTVSIGGAEAEALARQMVLASAAGGGPDDVRIALFGISRALRGVETLPGMSSHDWEDAGLALREVQAELLRRARLFFDEGVEDIWGHISAHSDERVPALLVVASEPPAALRGVVEAFGREGPKVGTGLLPLGWRPAHSVVHAEAGSLAELDLVSDLPIPRQLSPLVLDREAAAQVVEVLFRAFPNAEDAEPEPEVPESETPSAEAPVPNIVSSPTREVELWGEASLQPPGEARAVSPPEPPTPEVTDEHEEPPSKPDAPRQEVSVPPPTIVSVRCLGGFEVRRDERVLRKGWRNKARELLAYLIAHPSGAPKDRIVEELWPGIDPGEGSERFDRMASEVRSRVRGCDDTGRYVDKEDDVFYLEPGTWWSDAWELERLVSEADQVEELGKEVTKLREAVGLYRGEFCRDYYYPWAEGVRERFRALAVRACARLADLLSDQGEHEEAIAALNRGIEADPICEDLSRRAMAIEARLGRRAGALSRYRKLEARLDAELSVEPDPETQALAAQLQVDSKGISE
jgi:DNA-binding SARP family transcriptional activator/LysM repeat protein